MKQRSITVVLALVVLTGCGGRAVATQPVSVPEVPVLTVPQELRDAFEFAGLRAPQTDVVERLESEWCPMTNMELAMFVAEHRPDPPGEGVMEIITGGRGYSIYNYFVTFDRVNKFFRAGFAVKCPERALALELALNPFGDDYPQEWNLTLFPEAPRLELERVYAEEGRDWRNGLQLSEGVWAAGIRNTRKVESALRSDWFGWCADVEALKERFADPDHGGKCW